MKIITKLPLVLLALCLFANCSKDDDSSSSSSIYNGKTTAVFNSDISYGTMTDQDGNTYKTVTIGTQTWMAENLRTTTYNDGTPIPNVTDDNEWSGLDTGAYCNYNNTTNVDTIATFGRLYNWYAVNTELLAPEGWHVPSTDEWNTLVDYLIANGYNYDGTTSDNKIAKSLAATNTWNTSEESGDIGYDLSTNNSSGFTALATGYRYFNDGEFMRIGEKCNFQSTNSHRSSQNHTMVLSYKSSELNDYDENGKGVGNPVRCIKD